MNAARRRWQGSSAPLRTDINIHLEIDINTSYRASCGRPILIVRQPDLHACFHINDIDLLGYWLGIKAIDMKLGTLAAPAITVAAIALLVVAAAGLLPAMGVLASSSADGQGETPTPVAAVESTAEPSATSTPVPFNLPAAPDKSEPPALPANRSAKGRTSEVEGSGEGTVYT